MAGVFACAMLVGCAPRGPVVLECSGPTMGTRYHVRFVAPEEHAPTAAAQRAIDEVLHKADADFSLWRDDSVIARFNAFRDTEPFAVDAEFLAVVKLALRIAEASDGAYDPTILPVTRLWGFAGGEPREPDEAALAAALACVGWRKLEITPTGALRKLTASVEIDLNSIAPGRSADQISERLSAIGFPDHMVEVGGGVMCRGRKPGGEAWRIGIERPAADGTGEQRPIQEVVQLSDRALATSGSYRNWFESGGSRRHHILDARTGHNRVSNVVSVSVEAPDCMLADGLSTALMLTGPDGAASLCSAFAPAALRALFLVAQPDGSIVERRIGW